jgi:hypothetical protein
LLDIENFIIFTISKQQTIKIMISKDKIKSVQEKIKLAILEIEKSENVKINFGSIRYTSLNYTTTMTVTSNGAGDIKDKLDESISKRYGFTKNIIGMKIKHPRVGDCTIVEFVTKNRKYPVIFERDIDGKRYKSDIYSIKSYLGGDKLINRNYNLNSLLEE